MAIYDFNTSLLPGITITKPYNPQKTRVIIPEPGTPGIWTIPAIEARPATPEIPAKPAVPEIPFRFAIPEIPYQAAKPEVPYQPAKYAQGTYHPAANGQPEYWEQGELISPEVPYQPASPEILAQDAIPEQPYVPGIPAQPAIPAQPEVKAVPALEMIELTCITREKLPDGERVETRYHIYPTEMLKPAFKPYKPGSKPELDLNVVAGLFSTYQIALDPTNPIDNSEQ
jgi:hypothetical protein